MAAVYWNAAIEWKSEALKRFLAMFVAMLAGGAGPASPDEAAALPRHLYRALLALLRPAESAARRLIIVAALDPTNSTRLRLRISAFYRALDDLPAQVRRFASWQSRDAADRVRRLGPIHDVHQLLTGFHALADWVLDPHDTS
jgi:hypothetical protein